MLKVLEKGMVLDKDGNLYCPYINLTPKQVREMLLFKHCLGPTYIHIHEWLKWIDNLNKGDGNGKDHMRTFARSYKRIKR